MASSSTVSSSTIPLLPTTEGLTRNQLGTINGCYIPCLLNILGAPLFLFVGFSVGMLGWPLALAMFCFSETIAYLTITSFSALVTNGSMKGGGAYYMISRSLGPALGGSSGLLFWLTYCINVTFNMSAFTDTVFATWFPAYASCTLEAVPSCWYKVAFSTVTLLILFLIAYRGAAAFARVNYFIFSGLVVALIVAIGSVWLAQEPRSLARNMMTLQYTPSDSPYSNVSVAYRPFAWEAPCPPDPKDAAFRSWCHLGPDAGGGNGTWGLRTTMAYRPVKMGMCDVNPHSTIGTLCDLPHVFSFVFPAVVGMMEGANLSGDLADPGHSIPRGTLGAVTTAFLCYILLIIGQGGTMDRGALQFDLHVMQSACVSQYFVVLGVATACLSTALGSMFGSARIMQALARDGIYPQLRAFATGAAQGDEPRRALVLTYLLAQAGLFYGGIDAVAPVLTNFFLITYTLTNASAALLELSGIPNFRPRWRYYSWHLSLLGAALTVFAMCFLNVKFAIITFLLVLALMAYIYTTFDGTGWPDISQAYAFSLARVGLEVLQRAAHHPKFWRPNIILVLSPVGGVEVESVAEADAAVIGTAAQLSQGALLIIGQASVLPPGSQINTSAAKLALAAQDRLSGRVHRANELLVAQRLPRAAVFETSCVCTEPSDGIVTLVTTAGMGALRVDSSLMNLPGISDSDAILSLQRTLDIAHELHALRKNVLLLGNLEGGVPLHARGRCEEVHIWLLPGSGVQDHTSIYPPGAINGDERDQALDASLALQFGRLAHAAMARSVPRCTKVPCLQVFGLHEKADSTQLRTMLRALRIDAEATALAGPDLTGGTLTRLAETADLLRKHSSSAALVLVALPSQYWKDAEDIRAFIAGLPPVLLCTSGGDPTVTTAI